MIKPEFPQNEKKRLEALNSYDVLDTLPEKEYDNLTKIASEICNTPMALITLIDSNRQWFKSHRGIDATETPRELAFCAHAIHNPNEIMVVSDARKDERFHDNPLVTGEPQVVFYAGAPLITPEGHPLGTLCVVDTKSSMLTPVQQETLTALAEQVVSRLELRKTNRELIEKNKETIRLNHQLSSFSYTLSHDLKTPLRGIKVLTDWLKQEYSSILDDQANEWINLIASRILYMDALINGMLEYSETTNSEVAYERFDLESHIVEVKEICDPHSKSSIQLTNCNKTIVQSKFLFGHIFQNLISNSIKFNNKDNCQIHINLIEVKKNYEITYEDNGPGIPERHSKKIFKLFETLNTKKEDTTGIGMAIVHTVINNMGGTIDLGERSEGREGVRFKIVIPNKQIENSKK